MDEYFPQTGTDTLDFIVTTFKYINMLHYNVNKKVDRKQDRYL